ncbi:O-succinylbenzoate synthase [Janibacter sp. HTCC2649]|uniref:hypothetical protein n=1 Tax=Janibacter sp. HTCC2649 TaxID=313589 RepID=UPI0000670AA2|nr:hypothetical protein [Janibacter sp. HTCC2649]EAQ00333.1 O-succinylbenzoate synthase [Janibacter sp. HTCC2649]
MATLQVKNVPDDLYAAVKARAVREHLTVSDLVLRNLRREVALPSRNEWIAEVTERAETVRGRRIDVQSVVDEVRAEFE